MAEQNVPPQSAHGLGIAQAQGPGAAATVNIGLTHEQVRDLALEITRNENAALAKVEALARELEVTKEAVTGFLKIITTSEVPFEIWPQALTEIAQRHRELRERLGALAPDDPAIKAIIEEARAVIDRADSEAAYDRADRLLGEAEAMDLRAIREAEALEQKARTAALGRRLRAAATRAERGELSLMRLNYLEAAQHFKSAAEVVPAQRVDLSTMYLNENAQALVKHGDEKGENSVLVEAIVVYRRALQKLPKSSVQLIWAMTQTNLGNALSILGARESGTEKLEQAVEAYREALKERTRERVLLDWADTQADLATALSRLGEREMKVEHLREAINAFHLASAGFKEAGITQYDATFDNLLKHLMRQIKQLNS